MIVYKFGGASVQSADGVRNIEKIISKTTSGEKLIVIVSAMGKTTNAIEDILKSFCDADTESALCKSAKLREYHYNIASGLGVSKCESLDKLFDEFEIKIKEISPDGMHYDNYYDMFVSFGEMFSTTIISDYLSRNNHANHLIDMRGVFITDDKHREANIDYNVSQHTLSREIATNPSDLYIAQGFIGGTLSGEPTTLGREGSDYTAAAVANILDCSSVTIWKDVDGILNADPRIFKETVLIDQLSYTEAVELAFSGAKIIHPKTIKPLQNKSIPLYVKPFSSPERCGSVIRHCDESKKIEYPVYIVRKNQVMISIRPKDFSFVLEDSLADIFATLNSHRQKVNLIQNSAIRITISVDASPYFNDLICELNERYNIKYTESLELITVRGKFSDEIAETVKNGKQYFIEQRSKRSYKLLYSTLSNVKQLLILFVGLFPAYFSFQILNLPR